MKQQKGVTLIELMIAVAVIGVLTAIAYPSYQTHVLKGHRSQAMADMMKIQLTLEENYTQSGAYDYSVISGGSCSFCEVDSNRYQLKTSHGTGMDTYKIIATPQSTTGQDNDDCGTLGLNAAGIGTAAVDGCW